VVVDVKSVNTNIFLAGGGNAEESKLLDAQFAAGLDPAKPVVYIPNAMRSRPYQSGLEWFRPVMAAHGAFVIEMWDDLKPRRAAPEIAGVYIGGGDTAKLLMEVREKGFDAYLHEAASYGIPIYGGSAGATILGEDVRTTPEALYLSDADAAGLKMVSGYSIVCHYRAEHDVETRRLSETLGQNLIAIPEKTGGHITGQSLTNYGTEPIIIFRDGKVEVVKPFCATVLLANALLP
jgi:dipeptidase E